jgi:hypothetical protein
MASVYDVHAMSLPDSHPKDLMELKTARLT